MFKKGYKAFASEILNPKILSYFEEKYNDLYDV